MARRMRQWPTVAADSLRGSDFEVHEYHVSEPNPCLRAVDDHFVRGGVGAGSGGAQPRQRDPIQGCSKFAHVRDEETSRGCVAAETKVLARDVEKRGLYLDVNLWRHAASPNAHGSFRVPGS